MLDSIKVLGKLHFSHNLFNNCPSHLCHNRLSFQVPLSLCPSALNLDFPNFLFFSILSQAIRPLLKKSLSSLPIFNSISEYLNDSQFALNSQFSYILLLLPSLERKRKKKETKQQQTNKTKQKLALMLKSAFCAPLPQKLNTSARNYQTKQIVTTSSTQF